MLSSLALEYPTSPWTLKDGSVIHLIQGDDLRNIPDGTVLVDIFGQIAVKGTDTIDDDTRFGYLAYGVRDA